MEQNCPICMLHYDDINMLKCCKAMICTECYLQAENPDSRDSPCPFCKNDHMSIVVARRLCDDEAYERAVEEQKVIEATFQARNNAETATLQYSSNSSDISTIQGTLAEESMVDIPCYDNQYDAYGQMGLRSCYDERYDRHRQMGLELYHDYQYDRHGQIGFKPYPGEQDHRHAQMRLRLLHDEWYHVHEQIRARQCNDEKYDRHEQTMVKPFHHEHFEGFLQTSDNRVAGYEGFAEMNERHFPSRNNLNTSSDVHYLHSTRQLNINDRNNDFRSHYLNANERENGLQTATELFLSEISIASKLELDIQFSLMEPDSPVDHDSFLY